MLAKYRLELRQLVVRRADVCSLCCGFRKTPPKGIRTLALCTWVDDSNPIRSQVAHCYWSSNILYSGVCGAGGETGCSFYAYPHQVWGKEASGASMHQRGNLNDTWGYGPDWSGVPLGVRCVVALEKQKGFALFYIRKSFFRKKI